MCERIIGLDPIVHASSKILILGSMPSVQSLKNQGYYFNPTNRFWKVMEAIYGKSDYPIALWDVCHSCIRKGSMDANIKDVIPNDIERFLKEHGQIKRVVCNGSTSYKLLKKYFPNIKAIAAPSTSAANARYRFDDLVKIYKECLGES